jgi:hypothetical protein
MAHTSTSHIETSLADAKQELLIRTLTNSESERTFLTVRDHVAIASGHIARLAIEIGTAKNERLQAKQAVDDAIMRGVELGSQRTIAASTAAQNSQASPQQPVGSWPSVGMGYQQASPTSIPIASYQPTAQHAAASGPHLSSVLPPRIKLPLEQQPWYFGSLSRIECEQKLTEGSGE